jgi:hypothetical protein
MTAPPTPIMRDEMGPPTPLMRQESVYEEPTAQRKKLAGCVSDFEDCNINRSYVRPAPSKLQEISCKLAYNIVIKCQVLDSYDTKSTLGSEFPCLTLLKLTKEGRVFPFHIPYYLTATLHHAITYIMNRNKHFHPGGFVGPLIYIDKNNNLNCCDELEGEENDNNPKP